MAVPLAAGERRQALHPVRRLRRAERRLRPAAGATAPEAGATAPEAEETLPDEGQAVEAQVAVHQQSFRPAAACSWSSSRATTP